jgi:hypothetical protein
MSLTLSKESKFFELKMSSHFWNVLDFCKYFKMYKRLKCFCLKVAKHIGSNHYSFTFTVQEGLDVLSDVIYHLEVKFETNHFNTVDCSLCIFLFNLSDIWCSNCSQFDKYKCFFQQFLNCKKWLKISFYFFFQTFDLTTVRASTPMFLLARRVKVTTIQSLNLNLKKSFYLK